MEILGCVDIPMWILLSLLCLSLLVIYGYYPMDTWQKLGIPGPRPLPFIGNMHEFLNPRIGVKASVDKWKTKYGKVFGIYYFRKPCLVVLDTQLFSEIFVKEFSTFHDRFVLGENFISKTVMDGVAFQKGDAWKRIRNIMTPTFTTGKLKLLTEYMNNTSRNLAKNMQDHAISETQVVAKDIFAAFSLDTIAGIGFGLDIDSQNRNDEGVFKQAQALFRVNRTLKLAMAVVGMFPFSGILFQKMNVSLFNPEAISYFKNLLGKIVDDRKSKNNREQLKRTDFFQLLLDAEIMEPSDESESTVDKKLTPDEIVCQGITFIMAGYETTSTCLQFLSQLLAENQDVQDKMKAEVRSVLSQTSEAGQPENCDDSVSYEQCQQMKYMEAVLHESLRMYSPLAFVKREAMKDTSLGGYKIPKNSGIIVPTISLGRDPELFDEPDKFNPERYMNTGSTKLPHFNPFGMGPRQCIGMRLAMLEMKIALAHIMRTVTISGASPPKTEVQDYTGLIAPKQPIKLSLTLSSPMDS